jgi:hypothetical protein
MTAITLKQAVDRLTLAQLTDLGSYIQHRIAELEDAALLTAIVADQKVNPVTAALPPGQVERNNHGWAIFEHIQQQKADERAAAAEERARGNGGTAH